MIEADQLATDVVAWVRKVCPDIASGYAYAPAGKPQALPDVVADYTRIESALDSPDFPFLNLQETWIWIFNLQVTIMVDNSDEHAAATKLRGYVDALTADLYENGNLGGAVEWLSPRIAFDLTPPLVEYEDGTRGREMTLLLAVAEPIPIGAP